MRDKRNFASDNNATVHPEIMQALINANVGHAISYGDDEITQAAVRRFKEIFGEGSEVHFVYNGTGANVLGMSAVLLPFNAVLCPASAHINCDECGAPERFTGCKLIDVPTEDGKIGVGPIEEELHILGNEHHSQPRVVSVTQSTELGTVYTPAEIRELAALCHRKGLYLHMDGARLFNAAASLGLGLEEVSTGAGVDILSFGGTKNGMMFGEAVVFAREELSRNFRFIRKNGMQLASKMRFISAQFLALLTDRLWYRNAKHANDLALLLEDRVRDIPGVEITQRVEANAVFASIPRAAADIIREKYFFYMNEVTCEARWMTAFDTTEQDVLDFVRVVREAAGRAPA